MSSRIVLSDVGLPCRVLGTQYKGSLGCQTLTGELRTGVQHVDLKGGVAS